MSVKLDEELIMQARRLPRQDGLSMGERIAMNLFWRKGVRVTLLAKIFQCSKNTIYYSCLTGDSAGYPSGGGAREINKLIDTIGADKAWNTYVTEDMIRAVNAANKEIVTQRVHAA